jgi:uncharacterized delta-60 repeat protein
MVIQPDGKILLAGTSNNGQNTDMSAARFDQFGNADPSFDNDGETIIPLGTVDAATAVGLQQNGKIILSGWVGSSNSVSDLGAVRLTTSGVRDVSFGPSGLVQVSVNSGIDRSLGAYVASDDSITLVGFTTLPGGKQNAVVVKLTSEGLTDTSFNGGQPTVLSYSANNDQLAAVVGDAGGNVYCAGRAGAQVLLTKYTASGSPASDFNNGTVVLQAVNSEAYALAVGLDSAGRVVLVGSTNNGVTYSFYSSFLFLFVVLKLFFRRIWTCWRCGIWQMEP